MYLLFVDNIECFLVRVFQLLKRGTWSPKLVKLLINDLAALQLSDNVQLSTETVIHTASGLIQIERKHNWLMFVIYNMNTLHVARCSTRVEL